MRDKKLKMFATAMVLFMFVTAFATRENKALKEVTFKTNITCDACKTAIETGFSDFKGVEKTDVNVEAKTVTLAYDDAKTNPEALKTKIKDLGYTVDENKAGETTAKAPSCCSGAKASTSSSGCAKSACGK